MHHFAVACKSKKKSDSEKSKDQKKSEKRSDALSFEGSSESEKEIVEMSIHSVNTEQNQEDFESYVISEIMTIHEKLDHIINKFNKIEVEAVKQEMESTEGGIAVDKSQKNGSTGGIAVDKSHKEGSIGGIAVDKSQKNGSTGGIAVDKSHTKEEKELNKTTTEVMEVLKISGHKSKAKKSARKSRAPRPKRILPDGMPYVPEVVYKEGSADYLSSD
jgi:hypothetical protein